MGEREMTVTEAARQFSDLINRTLYRGKSTVLVRSNQPVAEIIPISPPSITGREWLKKWALRPRLEDEDVADFEKEVLSARNDLSLPDSKWD